MATISNGSVTITLAAGETYRFKASGEAYVEIGGGSSESYRLIGASNEKVLGNFAQSTPVTIRVVSGSVDYNIEPITNGFVRTGGGKLYDEQGNEIAAGGTVSRPAGTSIVLDADSIYGTYTVTGATALTVSGSQNGAEASMIVLADGSNVPTISGADEWASSFGYLNTAGVPNLLTTWHDGFARRFAWSQQMVPTAIDTTAPTLTSAVVSGSTLTLTYSENLNTTAPAASAFTVNNTTASTSQNPSNVSVSLNTVILTLGTSIPAGNTVNISYVPPGSNPIRDTAGNAAAALTTQAVTNEAVASILELTTLIKLTQGTGGTDDVYVADASGVTSFGAIGRTTLKMAGDGWVSVDWASASNGAVIIGLDANNNVDWAGTNYPDFYMQMSTTANTVSRGNNSSSSTLIESAYTPSATARYRIKRTGTTVTIEKSNDSGANWTVIYTFAPASTGDAYVTLLTVQNNMFYRPRQVGMA